MVEAVRKICQQRCQETLWKNQFSLVERTQRKQMKIKTFHFLHILIVVSLCSISNIFLNFGAFQILFETHKTVISVWQVVYNYHLIKLNLSKVYIKT